MSKYRSNLPGTTESTPTSGGHWFHCFSMSHIVLIIQSISDICALLYLTVVQYVGKHMSNMCLRYSILDYNLATYGTACRRLTHFSFCWWGEYPQSMLLSSPHLKCKSLTILQGWIMTYAIRCQFSNIPIDVKISLTETHFRLWDQTQRKLMSTWQKRAIT